jgi:hypothetical protein
VRTAAIISQLALLAWFACSPDDSPITRSAAEAACLAECERFTDCHCELLGQCSPDDSFCFGDDCAVAAAGNYRTDAFVGYQECIASTRCEALIADEAGSLDHCLEDSCEPTDDHLAFESRCRDILGYCRYTPHDIGRLCETDPSAGGDVGWMCLSIPEAIRELGKCLAEPCSDIPQCMEAAGNRYGILVSL